MTKERTRKLLAVAEYNEFENVSQVAVLYIKSPNSVRRLKELRVPEVTGQEEFITLGFSYDSKLLAAVSNEQHIGIVWDWYRDKVRGKFNLGSLITRITINPKFSHLVSTSGPNHWKTWRIEEKTFKQQPMFSKLTQNQNFVDHDWIDENTVIAVTDMAEAFISKDNEILQYIEFAFGQPSDGIVSTSSVTGMLTYSKGFIIANDEGQLALWECSEVKDEIEEGNNNLFDFIKTWSCGKKQAIVSLALTNNEENLAVALKSSDIGICSLSQVSVHSENREIKFNFFCSGFHSGAITCLDVALQRPLLVTCSQADATIRIWNYNSLTCELAKKLYVVDKETLEATGEAVSKPLQCVAFHPSGYYLAIGFVDKLRLFHLLYDELRFFREVSLGRVNNLKFSNGGHMLAAASIYGVGIYSAYTLDQLCILKNHASTVTDIIWTNLDKRIITIGTDGAVYEYFTSNWSKEREHVIPSTEYSSATLSKEDMVVVCGMDSNNSILLEQMEYDWKVHYVVGEKKLSQACYFYSSSRNPMLLTGCTRGNLQLFGPGPDTSHLDEVVVHQGAITQIKAAPDGRYLFTAGEDGNIFIFKVNDAGQEFTNYDRSSESKDKEISSRVVDDGLAEIVLIEKKKLELLRKEQEDARKQMEDIKDNIDQNSRKRELEYKKAINEEKESMLEEIKQHQSRIDQALAQKAKQERDFKEKLRMLEDNHLNQVDDIETVYEKKLNIEDERYRQLEHDKVEMRQHYEDQIRSIKQHNEDAIRSLENAFREALKKAQSEYDSTKKTAEELKGLYENRLSQQVDEHEIEVIEIKQKYQEQLASLKRLRNDLATKQSDLRVDQDKSDAEKRKFKTKLLKKKAKIHKRREIIAEMKAQIKNLETAKKEKEETLMKKESKLYEYKHQIKELLETKNQLITKKREILDEMQPKEEEIEMLQSRLQSVHMDFKREREENEDLQRELQKKDDLIKRFKIDNKAQQNATYEIDKIIKDIMNDIHYTVSSLEVRHWKDELKKLYQIYVKEDGFKIRKDADNIEEMEHQLKYMEKSMTGIRDTQIKAESRFKVDMRKRTQENSTLIQELNKLRLDYKQSEMSIKQLQMQIAELEQEYTNIGGKEKIIKQISSTNLPKPKNKGQVQLTPYQACLQTSPTKARFATFQDRQRVMDLMNELEEKKEQNFYLRMEIAQLKETLLKSVK